MMYGGSLAFITFICPEIGVIIFCVARDVIQGDQQWPVHIK
jgi:hypothetical protein